jgi:phospholipid/cholesterol/gamma-HCH transport system ATP-binding protein
LILKPDIILYDEPTTGLDPITSKEISKLMVELQKKYNTTSIIISHDINCIEITAERVVLLIDGKNYVEDRFENMKTSTDPRVKQFFE